MSDVNAEEEQDILEKFRTAVRNGQTRLALEALIDVIDAIVEAIVSSKETAAEETEQATQSIQDQTSIEQKTAAKKKTKEQKENQSVTAITE
jgi:FKBP-type peptidyl-prolyl cis-trans isomerase